MCLSYTYNQSTSRSDSSEFSSNPENYVQEETASCYQHKKATYDLSDFIHKPDEADWPKWLPCGILEVTNQILVHDYVHQQSELLDNSRQYRNAKVIRYVIPPTTLENGSNKREFPFIGEDTRYQ
jgi:hypothetical protein